jgi:CubicO group peptidase (beta-lactamase class C family)
MKERTEPGMEYKYNNTGYGLLALLVQRVVGRTFAEHMSSTVFQPLGMTRTRYHTICHHLWLSRSLS